jgi:hypothetical protein
MTPLTDSASQNLTLAHILVALPLLSNLTQLQLSHTVALSTFGETPSFILF